MGRQLREPDWAKCLEACDCPSLVVSDEIRVIAYNRIYSLKFCRGGGKPTGLPAGEFMGCRHSLSMEGCGKKAGCRDCAILQTVVETLRTGKPRKNVRAHLSQEEDERRIRRELLISTVKRGGMVQVMVESFYTVLEPPSNSYRT